MHSVKIEFKSIQTQTIYITHIYVCVCLCMLSSCGRCPSNTSQLPSKLQVIEKSIQNPCRTCSLQKRNKTRKVCLNRKVFSAVSSPVYKQGTLRLNTQHRGRMTASSDLMSTIQDTRLALLISFRLLQAASVCNSEVCVIDVDCSRPWEQEKNTYLSFPPDNREI